MHRMLSRPLTYTPSFLNPTEQYAFLQHRRRRIVHVHRLYPGGTGMSTLPPH